MVADFDSGIVAYEILAAHSNRVQLASRWLTQAIVGARKASKRLTATEWRYVSDAYQAVGWHRVRWAASTDYGYGCDAFPSRDLAPRLDGFRAFSGHFGMILSAYCLRFQRSGSQAYDLGHDEVVGLAEKLANFGDEEAVGVHAVVEAMSVLPCVDSKVWTDPDALLEQLRSTR